MATDSVLAFAPASVGNVGVGLLPGMTNNYSLLFASDPPAPTLAWTHPTLTGTTPIGNIVDLRWTTTRGGQPIEPGVFLGYSLGVLNGLNMPGQLSEGSFHDVLPETRRLLNNHYRKMEAHAIRDAILQYYTVPAESFGIVAGIQTEFGVGRPINATRVRLLPENRVYSGDAFNNGFYMFDGVKAGPHTLSFETPNYETASVPVTLEAGKTLFLDRAFVGGSAVTIRYFTPATRDTIYPVNQTIGITFSAAMDTASVRQAFSITPSLTGKFTWYDGSPSGSRMDCRTSSA